MTVQPTRDQLRALALWEDAKEHQPDNHGPDRCGDPECFTSCVVDGCDWPCATAWLLDQLDQVEADVKRLSWSNGHLADKYAADMEELREELDQAEAELDSWMTRAYEAEKREHRATARIAEEKRLRMKATAAATKAERRITRLEAQTGIRGRAVVMYRERARQAEARIKAVRDVHTGTVWPGVGDKPICDACDQMWPCATTRALD